MKHKRKPLSKNTKLLIVLAALLITGQLIINGFLLYKSRQAHDTVLLSMISQAVDGLYKPAAVEANTGNSYFPEARLYVTRQPSNPVLLYNYFADGNQMSFNVTAANVLSAGKSKMWAAYANESRHGDTKAFNAMFSEVPNLQACARGLQLFYMPQTQPNLTESFAVPLTNGKTLYGYTEQACHQNLQPIVDTFKTVRSY